MYKLIFASLMISSSALLALANAAPASVTNPTAGIEYITKDPKELKDLQDSAIVSQSFVEVLDSENFGKSWSQASAYFQAAISQAEWEKTMNTSRKPLGKLIKREIADQRTSKDPQNLPKGDYMVLFYKSSFAKKERAYELVTLVKEDNQWKVLTYQIN
jgi:hypothetical protein